MSGVDSKQGRKSEKSSEGITVAVELMRLGLQSIKDPPPPFVLPKEAPAPRRR